MIVTLQTQRVQTLEQVTGRWKHDHQLQGTAFDTLRDDSREPAVQFRRTNQSPVSASNPQLNNGRPPSAPTTTTSSSHARSRSPPG